MITNTPNLTITKKNEVIKSIQNILKEKNNLFKTTPKPNIQVTPISPPEPKPINSETTTYNEEPPDIVEYEMPQWMIDDMIKYRRTIEEERPITPAFNIVAPEVFKPRPTGYIDIPGFSVANTYIKPTIQPKIAPKTPTKNIIHPINIQPSNPLLKRSSKRVIEVFKSGGYR